MPSGSDTTLFSAVTLSDINSISYSGCTLQTLLERWDETQQEYYALDTSTQPMSSWLQLDSNNDLVVAGGGGGSVPSPYVEYTIRVTYWIAESAYGEEAYVYDVATISIELANDCSDFRWADTSDTPSDGTYDIKAIAASGTHSISHPTTGLDATCRASPTVTLYY